MELTTQQRDVLETSTDMLVRGGPGSGKTTIGLLKAKARVSEGMAPYQTVLFLSFSNGAVAQIQKAAKLTLSAADRHGLNIQTFHSFCWGILRCYGGLIGLPLPLATVASEEEAVRCAGLPDDEWERQRRAIAFSEGRVAFDLFAEYTADLLDRCEQVRSLYASCHPLVIVDEFQDTDDNQWRVVDALTRKSQLIALADPHQRIYDFRPGVRPNRLELYTAARAAKVVDLGPSNHRSPDSDILQFAEHVLDPSRGPYQATSVKIDAYEFPTQCGVKLKYAIMHAEKMVRQKRGPGAVSVLVLGAANKTVQQVSQWLLKETKAANFQIRHDVWVDSDELACAWHVLVSLLEVGSRAVEAEVVSVLGRIADWQRCRATAGSLADATKIVEWAGKIQSGSWPGRAPLASQLKDAISELKSAAWTGDILEDVDRAITVLQGKSDARLTDIMEVCALRKPIRRGDTAHKWLETLHRETGSYTAGLQRFQRALQQERLTDRFVPLTGCNVMTLHKCKGKEFDAVIIFDGTQEPHRLVCRGDVAPFDRSRRLLRVGITRARFHVGMVVPASDPCQLLPGARSATPATTTEEELLF